MKDDTYSVIFRGDIVIGKNLPEVKQKLKKIFKVDDARIDKLFTGKPVSLKTNLSVSEAEKYQAVLQQAGIVVSIESAAEKKDKPIPHDKKDHKATVSENNTPTKDNSKHIADQSDNDEWKLAPLGSLLVDKKQTKPKKIREVNTDHLAVMAQEGNLIKDDERTATPAAVVDVDVLDWELTPYGESLLKEAELKKTVVPAINIDSLSLAKQEGDLLKEAEKAKPKIINIDTEHLKIVSED